VTIDLYGIANCDTVKTARAWLATRGLSHVFHDFKKEGVDPDRLASWAAMIGWERLLNTRGTTFRKLTEAERTNLDATRALALMAAHPSLIKRPVVEHAGEVFIGFEPVIWERDLA
jgi:arsenate reductase (glutaredoxin)